MATLTTSWQNIASWSYTFSPGNTATFYLDAKYSSQSIANNTTDIQTRLNSTLNYGSASGAGYTYTCSYAPTVSGSGVWTFENETITSGSATITHNSDGTKSLTLSASAANNYWGFNQSFSATVSLPTIPRQANITSASNFNDEQNPSFTYTNSANASLSCWLEPNPVGTHYAVRTLSGTSGTYTWSLTDEERNQLRSACTGKTCTCRIGLYSTISGTTYASYRDVTMTIVNGEPDLSYTVVETNQEVIDKIGTDDVLIKGISSPKVTLSATPKKYATISSYSINLSGYTYNTQEATFPYLINNQLTCNATDSRGFKKTLQETLDIVDYYKPHANITLSRTEEGEDTCYVTIDGTWYNEGFGETDNSLSITWEYRESDIETWTTGGTINATIDDNTFGVTDYLLGSNFSYAKEYKIRFTITDLFSEVTYIKTRTRNDYTLKDTYYESDILTYEDMNGIEDYIYETYALLNKQMGTSYSYTTQEWYKNSPMLVSKLNHIETGIKNLGKYYYRPEGWQNLKIWNATKPEKFDYTDVNRWIIDLNILTERLYNESSSLFPSDTLYPSETLLPH